MPKFKLASILFESSVFLAAFCLFPSNIERIELKSVQTGEVAFVNFNLFDLNNKHIKLILFLISSFFGENGL